MMKLGGTKTAATFADVKLLTEENMHEFDAFIIVADETPSFIRWLPGNKTWIIVKDRDDVIKYLRQITGRHFH